MSRKRACDFYDDAYRVTTPPALIAAHHRTPGIDLRVTDRADTVGAAQRVGKVGDLSFGYHDRLSRWSVGTTSRPMNTHDVLHKTIGLIVPH